MGAEPLLHEVAFRAAEGLVNAWPLGAYMHHTQLTRELEDVGGVEFKVTFSKPTPKLPVPPQVAYVLVTVEPPVRGSDLSLSYAIESELQRHAGTEPLRLAWLDAVILRKQKAQASVGLFEKKGMLVEPQAFVPAQHFDSKVARPVARKPAALKTAPTEVRVRLAVQASGSVSCSIQH